VEVPAATFAFATTRREVATSVNYTVVPFDHAAYFSAGSPTGTLWSSDGTTGGTAPVPGSPAVDSNNPDLTPMDNKYLFFRSGSGPAAVLETFDGKGHFTVVPGVSDPYDMVSSGHTLYFFATSPASAGQHWLFAYNADKGATPTVVKSGIDNGYDLTVLGSHTPDSDSGDFKGGGNRLYYAAQDTGGGSLAGTYQLWFTNAGHGTTEVTSTPGGANPYDLTPVDNKLYFGYDTTGTGNFQIGVADDKGAVKTYMVNPVNSAPYDFTPFKGAVYFGASDTGNPASTSLYMLKDNKGPSQVVGTAGTNPYDLTEFKNFLYYGANDPNAPATQVLWRTDGNKNTYIFNPNATKPHDLTVVNDTLFFGADSTSHLWYTDGTTAGTGSFIAGPTNVSDLTAIDRVLYFDAGADKHLGIDKTKK